MRPSVGGAASPFLASAAQSAAAVARCCSQCGSVSRALPKNCSWMELAAAGGLDSGSCLRMTRWSVWVT